MEINEFRDGLDGCTMALFDVDGTLVDGNVSAGIGKRYIKKAGKERDVKSAAIGIVGGAATLLYSKIFSNEQRGLEIFIGSLNFAGCANSETSREFAAEYIEKHGLPGIKDLVEYLKERKLHTIAFTGGLDVSADAAREAFGFDHSFANYTFDGSRIAPSRYAVTKRRPRKDLTALRYMTEKGYEPQKCLVVGDAGTDLPLMKLAGLSLASPLANPEVREAADLWTPGYDTLVSQLYAF